MYKPPLVPYFFRTAANDLLIDFRLLNRGVYQVSVCIRSSFALCLCAALDFPLMTAICWLLLIAVDLLDKCLQILERILNECLIGWFEQFKDDLIQRLKGIFFSLCVLRVCIEYFTSISI